MSDALAALRENVAILCGTGLAKRTGKVEKAKAVSCIAENLVLRATIAALSENSMKELCVGPPSDEMVDAGFLSWNGIAVEVILSMANMCEDALTAKTKKTTIRIEYMSCVRVLFKQALLHGPRGAIRSVVPGFLSYSYVWLSEPSLKDALAHDIWQCVRDILQVEENRAMLSAGYLKRWADICFQQITGRGPVYHSLKMATNLAHEAFVLLAKPVSTFDVLTQSQKKMPGRDMEGTDFGYVLLLERCCFLLVLAKSMKERNGRHVQATSLKCIAMILEQYSLDFIDSSAARTTLELAIPAILVCWVDRAYHECAVSAAKRLVRLVRVDESSLVDPIRERIERDFGREDGAASIVRAYEDVNEDRVEVAGKVFAVQEIVAKVKKKGMSAVQISAWLRVLSYVLKFEKTPTKDLSADAFRYVDLCILAVQSVSAFLNGGAVQRKLPLELLPYICNVVESATATILHVSSKCGNNNSSARLKIAACKEVWSHAYSNLLRQLMHVRHANSYRASSNSNGISHPIQRPMMRCVAAILKAGLVDKACTHASSSSGTSSSVQTVTWQGIFIDGSKFLTEDAARFAHAHVAQAGVRDQEAPNFRINFASMFISFCDPNRSERPSCTALLNCVSSLLSLSRGICKFDNGASSTWKSRKNCRVEVNTVDAFSAHFVLCTTRDNSSSKKLVERAKMCSMSSKLELSRCLYQIPENLCVQKTEEIKPSALSTRFTVSQGYRKIIERNFVDQMLHFLDSSFSTNPEENELDSSWTVAENDDLKSVGFKDHIKEKFVFLSDSELHKELEKGHGTVTSVAFLIAQYLEQGIRLGCISWRELEGEDSVPVVQLQHLLFLLLTKLAATPNIRLSGVSEIFSSLVSACSSLYLLHRAFSESFSSSSSMDNSLKSKLSVNTSLNMFGNLLSRIVGNVCEVMCQSLQKKTIKVVEKIKLVVAPIQLKRGTKRLVRESQRPSNSTRRSPRIQKKRRTNRRTSAGPGSSRREVAWSDDSENDSFPDESPPESDPELEQREFADTVSAFKRFSTPDESFCSSTADVEDLSEVLIIASRTLPQFAEIVLEQCKNCLQALLRIESRLSPDGPSRALVASGIIDPDYFSIRTCLWDILLELETGSLDAGKDIVHFGKKWETLEDNVSSVTVGYVNELMKGNRKHYPPLRQQEYLRLSFMKFSCKLLLKKHQSASIEGSPFLTNTVNNVPLELLSGIIDIAEVYRTRDAFRMPRYTRIAYLHFAMVVLSAAYRRPGNTNRNSEDMSGVDPSIAKSCNFIRKALSRLLSDCDASVRIATAGVFHIFLQLSKQAELSHVGDLLADSLPSLERCRERSNSRDVSIEVSAENDMAVDEDDDELGEYSKIWKLNRAEKDELKPVQMSFKFVGASSKALTALVCLGEISIQESDLLPLCLFEIVRRVANDDACTNIAFNVIICMCVRLGIASPKDLFSIQKRLFFPQWFDVFPHPRELRQFPAALFFDVDRHRYGGVFEWMGLFNTEILPFVLLSDADSFELANSKDYSRRLGEPLEKLLSSNVGCFSRIFPMIFASGLDHKGDKLWQAIDSALQHKSQSLLSNNRDDVHISLLLSISAGRSQGLLNCQESDTAPEIGFWRDCRETQPPYYDSMVVCTALKVLHTADANTSVVLRRSDLFGSLVLFPQLPRETEHSTDNFSSVSSAFVKKPGTLIRILLETWKLFSGPPGPVHPQNRVDAFFILATLWNITGVNLLLESNRRRLLLNLILQGFQFRETAQNALCLLRSVAVCSMELEEKEQVSLTEIFMNEELALDMDTLTSSRERRAFELLFITFPLLVQVALGEKSNDSVPICQKAAVDGLFFLVHLANTKEMWAPLAAVDVVPGVKALKEVKKIQETAMQRSFSKKIEDHAVSISRDMSWFVVAERRVSRDRRQFPLTLSRLTRLRQALTAENRALIISLIQEEAWLRSEGRAEGTLHLLNEILGFLIDINHDVCGGYEPLSASADGSSRTQFGDSVNDTRQQVLQECAWLIGVLGSVHPTSIVFESGRRRKQQRLNSLQYKGRYETADDGIMKALSLLRESLFGCNPVVAKSAYISLVALLGSHKGKNIFAMKKDDLQPLSEFRAIARKISISESKHSNAFLDIETGARVEPEFLSLTDKNIWIVPICDETNPGIADMWLTRLASTLSSASANEGLHALCSLCLVSPSFSRSIFPYLLMDFIGSSTTGEISLISEHIQTHVLNAPGVPFDAVRVVVHGLDFLCQLRLEALFEKGVGNIFKPSAKENVPFLYTLEIPYLCVADAAARVGMHFSAVRYASLHVDHECILNERSTLHSAGRSSSRGTRRLSSKPLAANVNPASRSIALKAAEHVLLVAAENINEPDMIRGLGQQGDLLETAANMSVLDLDWGRSVGALDAICHKGPTYERHTVSDAATGLGIQSIDHAHPLSQSYTSNPSKELMFLKSLRGLGCTNLVAQYWDQVKRKMTLRSRDVRSSLINSDGYAEKLNEQRFAVAWKLGDWESPDLIHGSGRNGNVEPVVGVHQTLHRALSFLSSGDVKSVLGAVQIGREAQADWLGKMDSSESAQRVYQVAERVSVLNQMESVVGLLKIFGLRNDKHSLGKRPISALESSGRDIPETTGHTGQVSMKAAFLEFLSIESAPSASSEFEMDLNVSIAKCLGIGEIISRISSNVSATIFSKGGSGAWARAAEVLGNKNSVALDEAPAIDVAAWRLQEAKLRWAASEDGRVKQFSLSKIKSLIEEDLGGVLKERASRSAQAVESFQKQWIAYPGDQDLVASVRAEACQLVASWSAAIRAEDPMVLFRSYLELGLLAFRESENHGKRGLCHYFMAEFADSQLSSIDNYRKTKKYDQMVLSIQEAEKKIKRLESLDVKQLEKSLPSSGKRRRASRAQPSNPANNLASDLKKHIIDSKKRMKQDRSRLETLNSKYKEWQRMSCSHYASSLRDGSQNDLRGSFRLVALWLDSGAMRDDITEDLTKGSGKGNISLNVPLEKLLPLAPQLCSRLGTSNDMNFQNTLAATLENMAIKFPSHCLWQLLALSNSTRVAANDERCASFYRGDKDKKEAAERILENVQATGSPMISQMKQLADAYIELSESKIDKNDSRKTLDISRSSLFKAINFADVPVPTTGLPLYGTKDSSFSPPCVVEFEPKARVCNGLSKPLKVICVGSDGHRYPQMIKGKDDLRGDAVMEQMFTILNELLRRDPTAARRRLLVRTYRVVPLSPFSGIMQFVDNTSQFKELLVNDFPTGAGEQKALHERYRPHDMKHWDMRTGVFTNMTPLSKKIQYLSLHWHRFQPVFRYFFLEQWPDPADWYTHQLAYTRSVAVMSIVGFILGIGDRHLANILVDTVSGEAVHIDFGIAFEQGKLLPTPELMPFRLSRDIVDGFGVSGVDGTFRRCSEVTLEVMRKNKDVLLTVIEVLLHDPMYNWALTPEEVLNEQLQGTQDKFGNSIDFRVGSTGKSAEDSHSLSEARQGEGSKEAQRALRRIAEKLDGLEDTERLSVEAHVARLVDEARAFQVLASVYPGWAPWL